jgi:hypothetical protein
MMGFEEARMTVQLDWPPEVVHRFTAEARRKGLSLDEYVLQSLLVFSGSKGAASLDETELRRKREQAAAAIRELRKDVTLGPDLTIRDLISEGRGL